MEKKILIITTSLILALSLFLFIKTDSFATSSVINESVQKPSILTGIIIISSVVILAVVSLALIVKKVKSRIGNK